MKFFGALLAAFAVLAMGQAHAADRALSPTANTAFLDANAHRPGVHVAPNGLQYTIIHNGYGKRPAPTDIVTVYYTGALINGKVFDGTEPGLPATFKANELIPGWTLALTMMREGDRWQIVVPANLGYGERGQGDGIIPPNQTLVFDLQLIKVTTPKEKEKNPNEDESSPGPGAD
jgi:FKBP-type peptidyl-prolyl cis-trans isomerase